ncbi:MAG TPA: hypothetical protein GXZ86_08965 [Clostridiales bacterium]|nr:hypothetical protein [Clostridiales bacterium]
MANLIETEIKRIVDHAKSLNQDLSDEKAFNILACSLLCYNSIEYDKNWYDINNENITDGKGDGGIDFVYYDDENSKVILGQNKYSENVDVNVATAEINKILHTLKGFKSGNTANYSKVLKTNLLNVTDQLNDENEGNVDVIFTSLSRFNKEKVSGKFAGNAEFSDLNLIDKMDLEKIIEDLQSGLEVVDDFSFDIDKANNALYFSSGTCKGIVVNISASSLKDAYDRYESKGLFNLNIRRHIKSKNVDEGIIDSINKAKDDFWFKNNGITIACKDYFVDGNTIKISDFSIVNGGQTTTLIAKHLKSRSEDFFVMCKIMKKIEQIDNASTMSFFNDIAEATNSQKPIQPRDLKSNAPEMKRLQTLFDNRGYFLEIKRGIPAPRKYKDKRIKNEELAQLFYSFVIQKPGTARSNKRSLFSNNRNYKQIFHQNYAKDSNKVDFLIDLVELNKRVDKAIINFKKGKAASKMDAKQLNVLNNSKLAIIALMGFIYRIANREFDVKKDELDSKLENFSYGYFISNYKEDDIDKKIEELVFELVVHITNLYETEFENNQVTSISNFLKTDKKYMNTILEKYNVELKKRNNADSLINYYGGLFVNTK